MRRARNDFGTHIIDKYRFIPSIKADLKLMRWNNCQTRLSHRENAGLCTVTKIACFL
jgi:hypothetical protein